MAPDGADTNLNPEQWALVRTKKFKAWFGDREPVFLNIKNPVVDNMERDYSEDRGVDAENGMTPVLDKAIADGNDGVIFTGITEQGGTGIQYVAFEPNQIKSATETTGEFSWENDD